MTELTGQGILDNSYWSYNNIDQNDQWHDNPIELWRFNNLEQRLKVFLYQSPYTCDQFDSVEHNSHWLFVPEHFDDSYCNLVLETLYDAEQSGGAFITEKIFKPIRHAQPFVVFGTVNTLATLRKLGYQTFDTLVDNYYDSEINNTERYIKTLNTITKMNQTSLHEFYVNCKEQLLHNQELFLASKYSRLEMLEYRLNND